VADGLLLFPELAQRWDMGADPHGVARAYQEAFGARSHAQRGDRDGARLLAHAVRFYGPDLPRLSLVWADAAYAGQLVNDLHQLVGWQVEVVKRSDTQLRTAFAVQPHRWIVERTFSWFGGFRRLSKDHEYQVESSEALIYTAMSHLMLRRLARSSVPSSPTG
jgi:transposase